MFNEDPYKVLYFKACDGDGSIIGEITEKHYSSYKNNRETKLILELSKGEKKDNCILIRREPDEEFISPESNKHYNEVLDEFFETQVIPMTVFSKKQIGSLFEGVEFPEIKPKKENFLERFLRWI